MRSRILGAILIVLVTMSPAVAEVVRIEVRSRADLVDGKPFGATGPTRNSWAASTSKSTLSTTPTRSHHRYRQGPEERAGARRVLVGLLPDPPQGPTPRQRDAPVRGVEPGRQGAAAVLQPRRGEPRSRNLGRGRRRFPDAARFHAALGRVAVRPAQA